jgi:hypothetical protein
LLIRQASLDDLRTHGPELGAAVWAEHRRGWPPTPRSAELFHRGIRFDNAGCAASTTIDPTAVAGKNRSRR